MDMTDWDMADWDLADRWGWNGDEPLPDGI